MEKIKKIINKIIEGDKKSFLESKKIFNDFFKNKTQKELDKLSPEFLKSMRDAYDLILNKKKLNEDDKSYLDYLFNTPISKYISLKISTDIDEKRLKRFARTIYDNPSFSDDEKNRFMSFVGWILVYQSWFDGLRIETKEKDLFLEFNLDSYSKDKPEISLLSTGDKKYKKFLEKIEGVLK